MTIKQIMVGTMVGASIVAAMAIRLRHVQDMKIADRDLRTNAKIAKVRTKTSHGPVSWQRGKSKHAPFGPSEARKYS